MFFFGYIYTVVLESFIWICRDESKNGNLISFEIWWLKKTCMCVLCLWDARLDGRKWTHIQEYTIVHSTPIIFDVADQINEERMVLRVPIIRLKVVYHLDTVGKKLTLGRWHTKSQLKAYFSHTNLGGTKLPGRSYQAKGRHLGRQSASHSLGQSGIEIIPHKMVKLWYEWIWYFWCNYSIVDV